MQFERRCWTADSRCEKKRAGQRNYIGACAVARATTTQRHSPQSTITNIPTTEQQLPASHSTSRPLNPRNRHACVACSVKNPFFFFFRDFRWRCEPGCKIWLGRTLPHPPARSRAPRSSSSSPVFQVPVHALHKCWRFSLDHCVFLPGRRGMYSMHLYGEQRCTLIHVLLKPLKAVSTRDSPCPEPYFGTFFADFRLRSSVASKVAVPLIF